MVEALGVSAWRWAATSHNLNAAQCYHGEAHIVTQTTGAVLDYMPCSKAQQNGDVVLTLLSFLCSGKQLWLPPVWEWQRGGRRGSYREERRGGTHKEEICFPGESQKNPLKQKKRTNKRDWFKVLYKLLVCPLQVNIKSLIFVHLLSLSSVKTCTWCLWYSSWRTTPGSPALRRLWRTWRRRRRK